MVFRANVFGIAKIYILVTNVSTRYKRYTNHFINILWRKVGSIAHTPYSFVNSNPEMVVIERTVFLLNFRCYGKPQQTNPAPS